MAKEKKEELNKEKKKISYETELALLGLMIVVVSLIGLLNQGYFGSIITYILVFIFGSWYYVVLGGCIYFGGYLFFKRKKPKFMTTLTTISFILLIVFLAIASSKYSDASLSNWYDRHKSGFNYCVDGIHVDISKINKIGGGIVGYSLYALLSSALGQAISNLVIVVFVLGFAYLAFKKPLAFTYSKFIKYCDTLREKKLEKQENKKSKEDEPIVEKVEKKQRLKI